MKGTEIVRHYRLNAEKKTGFFWSSASISHTGIKAISRWPSSRQWCQSCPLLYCNTLQQSPFYLRPDSAFFPPCELPAVHSVTTAAIKQTAPLKEPWSVPTTYFCIQARKFIMQMEAWRSPVLCRSVASRCCIIQCTALSCLGWVIAVTLELSCSLSRFPVSSFLIKHYMGEGDAWRTPAKECQKRY